MNTTLIITRLKACRESLGITKQEAAKRIGISQPAYVRYEAGTRTPSVQVIKEIAKVFNTSVDYLTGKSNHNAPDSIIIEKSDSPVLFNVIEQIRTCDERQLNKLMAYFQTLK